VHKVKSVIDKSVLRGDVLGGITAAAVALPLALAFGIASGLGALAGVYGAILVGFFASVFGGTASQISGPTGPMTVVVASVVGYFSGNLTLICTVIILAGLIQIAFGLAGFGRYIKLVPQPVVSGFMSGIGVIVIILQLAALLGYDSPDGSNLAKLIATWSMVQHPNPQALALGAFSFFIVSFMPRRFNRIVPASLLAVILGTVVGVWLFPGAPVIGTLPSGLPELHLPGLQVADVPQLLRFALMLAFLGSIDTLLTSLAADSLTHTHHDSNRELIGQGIGNLAAGFVGATPGAGATMRTFVNIRSGGTTRLSGAAHSITLLLVILVFAPVVSHVPLAVLGGILLRVGIEIIDWRNLRRVMTSPRPGVVIMLTTLLITVFVDLITAVAVGIVMASVLLVAKMADTQMASVKFHFGAGQDLDLDEEEQEILAAMGDRIYLFQMEGPLSFATARDITRTMQQTPSNEVLLIDLSKVPFVDSSAAATLEEATINLLRNGDDIVIFGASEKVMQTLRKADVIKLIGSEHVVDSRVTAMRLARHLLARTA
jgi:SulP family sulfate permease